MNTNRNNNRRRGRGNRNQGGGNQSNRIDSRARGNAPQMLDKYRKLAQDAQHNDDRVQAEYYLQFADHYFRVIADSKPRQDDARGPRREERDDRDRANDDEDDSGGNDRGRNAQQSRPNRDDRGGSRGDRDETRGDNRGERSGSSDGESNEFEPADNPFTRREEASEGRKPRAPRRAKRGEEGIPAAEGSFDAAVLPPSISAGEEEATPAPRPKTPRRRRKPEDGDSLTAVG